MNAFLIRKGRKILSLLMVAVLLASMVQLLSLTVWANDEVNNGEETEASGVTDVLAPSEETETGAGGGNGQEPTQTLGDPAQKSDESAQKPEAPARAPTRGGGAAVYNAVDFYIGDVQVDSQTVIQGGNAANWIPAKPWPDSAISFRGWRENNDTEFFDFNTPITEDTSLYAEFSDLYLIQYMNQDGKVLFSMNVAAGSIIPGISQNLADEVFVPSGFWFDHWKDAETGEKYNAEQSVATKDTKFIPVFSNLNYVFFISAGDQISPQLVETGNCAALPAEPKRIGYEFSHWSLSADSSVEYDFFNSPVTEDIFLYAVWTPLIVDYTVAIWLEKPDMFAASESPTPGVISQYNYVYSVTLQGTAGMLSGLNVSGNDVRIGNASVASINRCFTTANGSYNILIYALPQAVADEVISGNGKTVINLFAKRKVYTYTFNLGSSSPLRTMTVNGITYNNTGASAAKFSLDVKYEMDISGLLPVQGVKFATFTVASSNGFGSWTRPSTMTWKDNAGIASIRKYLDEGMLSKDGQTLDYMLVANWNASGDSYNYRYFVETYPGQPVTKLNSVVIDGVTYVLMDEFNQMYIGNLGQKSINGLIAVPLKWNYTANTTYEWRSFTYSETSGFTAVANTLSKDYYRCFFYQRTIHTLQFECNQSGMHGQLAQNEPQNRYIGYDAPIGDPPADPVLQGYNFIGWYRDAGHMEPFDWSVLMPNGGLIAYAAWEPNTLTVRYYDYYGAKNPTFTHGAGYNDYLVINKNVVQYVPGESYMRGVFLGWTWDPTGRGKLIPFPYEMLVTTNIDLYAVWDTNGYSVTYETGRGSGTVPQDTNVYSIGTSTRLPDGSMLNPPAGEVFYGWKAAQDMSGSVYYPGTIMSVDSDKRMVAQYAPLSNVTTITYIPNKAGATPSSNHTQYVLKDSPADLCGEIYTHERNTLVGWNSRADGNGISYALDQRLFEVGQSPIVLYGVWKVTDYTIIYDPGTQGTWLAADETYYVYSGDPLPAISINPATLHKAEYSFAGWDKPLISPVTGSATYTARWSLDTYLVTVNDSYAANSGGGTYAAGADVSIDAGSRDEYTFAGWTVNSENVSLSDAGIAGNAAPNEVGGVAAFTMPSADVTITANWTKNAPPPPGPSDPGPSDPGPSNPEPSNPGPSDPEPSNPGPSEPESSDPGPSEPEPSNPGPSNPEPSERPQIPGGTDFYTPPVPMSPGNQVVADENGGWLELDEEGVPLGRWDWDDDTGEWVFEDFAPPLSDMPHTGISSGAFFFCIVMIAIMLICTVLVIMQIKSKKNKKQD